MFAIPVWGATYAFSFPYGAVPTPDRSVRVKNKPWNPTAPFATRPDQNGIPPGINDPSGRVHILDVPTRYVRDDLPAPVHIEARLGAAAA